MIAQAETAVISSPRDMSDSDSKNEQARPSALVINSEQFTVWKDHYERLRKVFEGWEPQGGRILTVGKAHFACLIISALLYLV